MKAPPCQPGQAHRWRIDEPSGLPTVAAVCRNCGASREFSASGEAGAKSWREPPRSGP